MISLLDCTLRDGGQGLEDAYNNSLPVVPFDDNEIASIISNFASSNIEIIELGSMDLIDKSKSRFCTYNGIEELSCLIPKERNRDQMYVGLFRGPDIDIDAIPSRSDDLCDGVRVIIRYSELEKSLDYCERLTYKGYHVFIQPMVTARYTNDQMQYLIRRANEMNAYALYFVDSYGFMTPNDVEYYYKIYDDGLKSNISIGFHAHNNLDLAMANAITFLKVRGEKRNIIIDSTSCGIGQGAGNLQTEVIANYMNEFHQKNYDIDKIIDVGAKIDVHNKDRAWGYSLTKYISAKNKTAYKYAVALKNKYGKSDSDINRYLATIPEELRYRYTESNLEQLISFNKGKG